ncbi:MAG TPA: MFS transporter [Gaiellaceae bacterium]|nr:MFS transporter [Gaiellaceae bacterium]
MTLTEETPAAAASTEPPPLLRQPEFLKLWAAQSISMLGDQVTLLALPLVAVITLDASAAQMGFLVAAELMPHLLFSLFAGVWIERVRSRRRLMIVADIARASLLASIPIAAAFDALGFAQLYGVAFAVGTFAVMFDISWSTLFVSVVPRRDVVDANSKLSLSRSISFVAGPSVAGFLVQLLTAPVTLLVDATSYIGSALFLGRIRAAEPAVEEEQSGVLRSLRQGFGFVLRDEFIRPELLCVATINLFNFVFHAIFVLYATRELGVSPGLLGIVLGAGAVGGIVGALLAVRIERLIGIGAAFTLGTVLFPLPLVLVPLAGGSEARIVVMLGAAEFFCSVGVMILDVNAGSLMLLRTPDRLRARMSGTFRFVNYGIRPIGALLGGALGTAIGLHTTLWIGVLGALAGVIFLVFSPIPRLREAPAEAA